MSFEKNIFVLAVAALFIAAGASATEASNNAKGSLDNIPNPLTTAIGPEHIQRIMSNITMDHPAVLNAATFVAFIAQRQFNPFQMITEGVTLCNEAWCTFKTYANQVFHADMDEKSFCEGINADVFRIVADAKAFYTKYHSLIEPNDH